MAQLLKPFYKILTSYRTRTSIQKLRVTHLNSRKQETTCSLSVIKSVQNLVTQPRSLHPPKISTLLHKRLTLSVSNRCDTVKFRVRYSRYQTSYNTPTPEISKENSFLPNARLLDKSISENVTRICLGDVERGKDLQSAKG